jgi:MFS superfamily sulfate permease-like transporter
LINLINRCIPRAVIQGVQMAVGLQLLIRGVGMISRTGAWWAADGYSVAIVAGIIALLMASSRKAPAALLLFAAGLALTIVKSPQCLASLHLGLTLPQPTAPTWSDFTTGAVKAGIPQLPLTTLNSVIAVCALSASLFPDRPLSPRKISISVGLMNLVGVWFGAMPMCHGAGGLAGQYRFGARTNGSILFLGAVKVLLALLFGSSLLALAKTFPMSILGVMVGISGIELAASGVRDSMNKTAWMVVLATLGACLGLDNVALGFAVGLCCWGLLRLGRQDPKDPMQGPPQDTGGAC